MAMKFTRGDRVVFGSQKGSKTLGEIVKVGPKNLTIKQLQDRTVRGILRPTGSIWAVGKDKCRRATDKDISRALGPTQEELALMGTTTAFPAPRPSPYDKKLFRNAFEACESIVQASIFWKEETEKEHPFLKKAADAAAEFLKKAEEKGLR